MIEVGNEGLAFVSAAVLKDFSSFLSQLSGHLSDANIAHLILLIKKLILGRFEHLPKDNIPRKKWTGF